MGYNYTILYRKGKDNIVADALSRMHETLDDQENSSLELYKNPEDRVILKEGGMSGKP